MARSLFEAGFNWTIIGTKWSGFESAFEGFTVGPVALYHDEDLDRLLADKRIVRNGAKVAAVIAMRGSCRRSRQSMAALAPS